MLLFEYNFVILIEKEAYKNQEKFNKREDIIFFD